MAESSTLHLEGTPRPSDLNYWIHPGTNMISFAGVETIPVGEGLNDEAQAAFESVVGAALAPSRATTAPGRGAPP